MVETHKSPEGWLAIKSNLRCKCLGRWDRTQWIPIFVWFYWWFPKSICISLQLHPHPPPPPRSIRRNKTFDGVFCPFASSVFSLFYFPIRYRSSPPKVIDWNVKARRRDNKCPSINSHKSTQKYYSVVVLSVIYNRSTLSQESTSSSSLIRIWPALSWISGERRHTQWQ